MAPKQTLSHGMFWNLCCLTALMRTNNQALCSSFTKPYPSHQAHGGEVMSLDRPNSSKPAGYNKPRGAVSLGLTLLPSLCLNWGFRGVHLEWRWGPQRSSYSTFHTVLMTVSMRLWPWFCQQRIYFLKRRAFQYYNKGQRVIFDVVFLLFFGNFDVFWSNSYPFNSCP